LRHRDIAITIDQNIALTSAIVVDRPRSAFFLLLSGQAPRLAGRLEPPCLGQGPSGTRSRKPTRGHPCHDQAATSPRPPMPRSLPSPHSQLPHNHAAQQGTASNMQVHGWSRLTTNGPPRGLHAIWTRLGCGRPDTFNRGAHVDPDGRANPSFVFRDIVLSFSRTVHSLTSNPTETFTFA
jgi:hypothetical protein